MQKIQKFHTKKVKYNELSVNKRLFHKSTEKYIEKIRHETPEEVLKRAVNWINENDIEQYQITMIPIRIDPCDHCMIDKSYFQKRPNHRYPSNFVNIVEVYIIYSDNTELSSS